MKNIYTLLLIAFCLIIPVRLRAQTPEQINRVDSLMQAAHQLGIFNGNVLVTKKDKVVYSAAIGYADGSKTKMLNLDLKFDIGSIAKEFNGVSVMILQEQGKLKLDEHLSKYLPELPAWADSIQVAQLLNYTSGLPASAANTDEGLKDELMKLKYLSYLPGKSYIYSYSNVYLQRRIIEKVSGKKYNDFVMQYILKPCKMVNTVMDLPTTSPGMAIAFNKSFINEPYRQDISGWPRLTIADLQLFFTAINHYQLISKASVKQLSINFANGESSLGNAVFEDNELVWHQHQGSNYNYEALITCDLKEDISVILMTNNQSFKVNPLTTAIMAILKGRPYLMPKKSLYLDLREQVLADFDKGIAFYREAKEKKSLQYDFSFEIGELVSTGKFLMRRNRNDDAIRIFELGMLLDLKNTDYSVACQLTAEAYVQKGSRDMALLYYRKAVEKDPGNKIAAAFLEQWQIK